MKTSSMFKTLGLCALVSLSLGAGLAQADNGSCILGSSASPQAAAPRMNGGDVGNQAMLNSMEMRMNQQMDRIEQGLRSGQISPMQAGKMMREQWEAVQFQRGFLEGSRAAGGMGQVSSGGDSCGMMPGIDAKQLAAKMAPVVGSMAAGGMHTATTVMRALAREAEKLIREEAPMDERF